MAKVQFAQFRVSEEENQWIDKLAQDYGLDRSKLILLSLDYVRRYRPHFSIKPQSKEQEQKAEPA
jgi:hypothetical protein